MKKKEPAGKRLAGVVVPTTDGGPVQVRFGAPQLVNTQDGEHRKQNALSAKVRADLGALLARYWKTSGDTRWLFRRAIREKIAWVRYFES